MRLSSSCNNEIRSVKSSLSKKKKKKAITHILLSVYKNNAVPHCSYTRYYIP